jgi:mRNA-degrading endonuclease RelE of RelBE toxin-antitoxin system
MTFKVLIHPGIFDKIPAERKGRIKEALKELKDPLPGGNKKEVKGSTKTVYRLRVGSFRILYDIDFKRKEVLVFNILTAEQAHKKYERFK